MSLDDTFQQMRRFHQVLKQFNVELNKSMADLQVNHDGVSPHWQDEMRQEYDARWKQYLVREAPAYEQFLDRKLVDLARYLRGR